MPYSFRGRVNLGAYEQPFSGVGVEFYPLGAEPGPAGIVLHESGYLASNAQWNYPSVFSPFWRLYHNDRRGHCVLFGERMVELTPDRLVLIPDHHHFHCLGEQPVPTFWLAFSVTRQLQPGQPVPALLQPRDTELCLIRDLKKMIAANTAGAPTEAIYRNSLALLNVVLARPELRWQPPVPENLQRVRQHIEEHITEHLSNPGLARIAGMSVEGLCRAFRRYFGRTPSLLVREIRVGTASRRLLQTEESIDAVAEATGFPNRAYFTRVFKQITGQAPAAFRRRHRRI
jgi:AraC-like DNA-binding protein